MLKIFSLCFIGSFLNLIVSLFSRWLHGHEIKKPYLESGYIFNFNPLSSCSAQIKAISLGFCAEVWGGKDFASVISCRLTIAYPIFLVPSCMKLLPSVNHSASGLGRELSFKSGFPEYMCCSVSAQEWVRSSCLPSSGNRVAGFKPPHTWRVSYIRGVKEEGLIPH